ncbi:MAG TPA: CBS domain-containing protein [Halieaceae bacterium]|nr:CBS domain-containing protein [Halieaceae bacterium]
MAIKVKDIMTSTVTCGKSDYSPRQLESIMDKHKLRCLPIIDNKGRCTGVVNTTDLLHWHLVQKRASHTHAAQVLTQPVIAVSPGISLVEAVELMVSKQKYHLIVLEKGDLVGIVSVMDILERFLSDGRSVFAKHLLL